MKHIGKLIVPVAFAVLLSVTIVITSGADNRPLTVVSWGGSYAQACVKGYHERFTAQTGIAINLEDYNGGLAQIRAQVDVGNVFWDVVDLEIADLVAGCDEGLLVPVDVESFPAGADGTPAAEDFLPGTMTDCGPTSLFGSTIFAYNRRHFQGEKPSTIADFFDLETFPGRRGMRRSPQVNLEFALMADGVPIDSVYASLDTPAGVDRAFRKLDTIKEYIVWWEAGAQPPQMLADGEVAMTTAYNGRIFNAQVLENQPFVVVWDSQVYYTAGLGIVAGTRNLEAARKLVRFATSAESLAGVGRYIAYSPTRRSAMALIATHAEKGVDMIPHMPTSPENVKRALRSDWAWWSDHLDEMNERFSAWLAR
ncbi:MAG: ABC transporter substrate-binding protein [Gemmatimonadetes bacterium]|nr:ABC transporter substrate-binding protein [Gemmatimonadota bacterium]